jgi:glutamate-ammonia-ligase adenylyltransferase
VIRHPEEIATLAELRVPSDPGESGELFSAPFGWAENVSDPIFRFVATSAGAESERLALLRRHYRHRIFAMGTRDLMEARPVYVSLAAYTGTADDAIHAALTMAGAPPGMAVLALGRLGTGEFDVLSDADLIFVRDEGVSAPIAARAAEKAMHILAAYTREGLVFPVDARLRPHGNDGELVITPAQLHAYFEREAQAWEALSHTKLRYIAGAKNVADQVGGAAALLFARFRMDSGFGDAVQQMRQRLEAGEESPNLKTSPGAVYDIDFATGFLLVQSGVREMRGNLRDRLWRLAEAGALTKADAAALDHAAELFRTVDHVIRLVAGRSWRWLPGSDNARAVVEQNTYRILRRRPEPSLEAELVETMQRVRAIYERVLV